MIKRFLCSLVVIFVCSTAVYAGSIDYLSNQSALWIMNMSRNASTDAADINVYNPAGTALMRKGLYVDISSQTAFNDYSQYFTASNPDGSSFSEEYDQKSIVPIIPNAHAVYNFGKLWLGNLAIFTSAGIVGGGGALEWNGIAGTASAGMEISENLTQFMVSPEIKT